MATSQALSSPFLSIGPSILNTPTRHNISLLHNHKRVNFKIKLLKLPAGVELPKQQPKFQAPFLGFTRTAEIWNSRACMIGLIGTFIVELILNKGILQIIGLDIGKGLDIPL
ncbi:high-light-induced protein chloroplastic [Phtheirospermum japonicum]|uniref:High-light-induced protein chloroplastic n=1 Tax=Phtheirospermum japonicum TaxID=374723 RepID=A0A830DF03_9LAMI|nr:high-light-induced protein chloroplastic [Phtheirospermum japonicum]